MIFKKNILKQNISTNIALNRNIAKSTFSLLVIAWTIIILSLSCIID